MKMSRYVSLELEGHRNIYRSDIQEGDPLPRRIRVDLVFPERGTDESTGVLMLITGYREAVDWYVFQEMQEQFSNLYDMVVIQCDYYGSKYMGKEIFSDVYEKLREMKNLGGGVAENEVETGETKEEFNDMGIMQALDIVNVTLSVIYYLKKAHKHINTKKIILFGRSNGAYLAHLANLICPDLYNVIIDISGYLKPYFLNHTREILLRNGSVGVIVKLKYFLCRHPEYRYHDNLYDLRFLYKNRKNTCKIIAFQGKDDRVVDYRERESFIRELDSAELLLIDVNDVDEVLCSNAGHGLDMNFFRLFRMIMPMIDSVLRERSREVRLEREVLLGDAHVFMKISYESGFPRLKDIVFAEAGKCPTDSQ